MRRAVNQLVQSSFNQVKGRKALIVLTDGKDFGSYLTKSELLDVLQESDVMVYTVFFKTGIDPNELGLNPDGSVKTVTVNLPLPPKPKKKKSGGYTLKLPDGDFPTEEEIRQRERKDDLEAIDALKKMSDATAGRFYLKDVSNLKEIFGQIADELRKQYRLSYYLTENSSDKAAVYDFQVKIARPDAVIRTREGFRANPLKP